MAGPVADHLVQPVPPSSTPRTCLTSIYSIPFHYLRSTLTNHYFQKPGHFWQTNYHKFQHLLKLKLPGRTRLVLPREVLPLWTYIILQWPTQSKIISIPLMSLEFSIWLQITTNRWAHESWTDFVSLFRSNFFVT